MHQRLNCSLTDLWADEYKCGTTKLLPVRVTSYCVVEAIVERQEKSTITRRASNKANSF